MQVLTQQQTETVSGANSYLVTDCLPVEYWRSLDEGAQHEGYIAGMISAVVAGGATLALSSSALTGIALPAAVIGAAVAAAPWGYIYGYNSYELWPGNL